MRTCDFPDGFEVPQTTPQAERQRLVAKGKFLAEHCLDDGQTDCVLGFVEHCMGKSPSQLDVVIDLWRDLQQDYVKRHAAAVVADEQRLALLHALLQDITSRLMKVWTSL